MKIETKYDINQEVWFIEDNKVKNEAILKLSFTKDGSNESVIYYFKEKQKSMVNWERIKKEDEIFATKEELINSL
jgi:hypothetical protein